MARILLAALLLGNLGAVAAPAAEASSAASPPATTSPPSGPEARVVAGVYRGSLGSNSIEMTLTQDQDVEESVHGWYSVLGSASPERVLLAGEWEDDTLTLEESHNGIDVSGHWSAIFNADGFSGEWSDLHNEHAIEIDLHRIKPPPLKKKS